GVSGLTGWTIQLVKKPAYLAVIVGVNRACMNASETAGSAAEGYTWRATVSGPSRAAVWIVRVCGPVDSLSTEMVLGPRRGCPWPPASGIIIMEVAFLCARARVPRQVPSPLSFHTRSSFTTANLAEIALVFGALGGYQTASNSRMDYFGH